MAGPIPSFADPSVPAFGMLGCDFINNTFEHKGHWFVFQIIEDAVFAGFESETPVGGNAFVGEVIPAGTFIFSQFTSITLASGRGFAYRAVKEPV